MHDPNNPHHNNGAFMHQPHARKTVFTLLGAVLGILIVGMFAGWFFFGSSPETDDAYVVTQSGEVIEAETEADLPPLNGNPYEDGSGQSATYNFFYKMFGGIEDGLDDNPHNLKNVEQIDDFNIDTDELFDNDKKDILTIEQHAAAQRERLEAQNKDQYQHSVFDVVGQEIYDFKGLRAGMIHDIIVHKNTGEARAVIAREDDARYERELKAIQFNNVFKQENDGDVMLSVSEDTVEEKSAFNYAKLNDNEYVSLRHLRDGQLLDFEGNVAGQIDGIIYQNAEVQNIYFQLRPVLAKEGFAKFQLPFGELNIVNNPDGYDIQLDKEQTDALANALFNDQE